MTDSIDPVDELDELVWEVLEARAKPDEIIAEHHVTRYLRANDAPSIFQDIESVSGADRSQYSSDALLTLKQRYDADEEWEYDEDVTAGYGVSDGELRIPADDVGDALAEILDDEIPELGTAEAIETRQEVIGDYIRTKSQEELFEELQSHPDPDVSSAATQLNPELGPRSEFTYHFLLQYYCDEEMPIHLRKPTVQ